MPAAKRMNPWLRATAVHQYRICSYYAPSEQVAKFEIRMVNGINSERD